MPDMFFFKNVYWHYSLIIQQCFIRNLISWTFKRYLPIIIFIPTFDFVTLIFAMLALVIFSIYIILGIYILSTKYMGIKLVHLMLHIYFLLHIYMKIKVK